MTSHYSATRGRASRASSLSLRPRTLLAREPTRDLGTATLLAPPYLPGLPGVRGCGPRESREPSPRLDSG